jgi:hypothetical protein
LFRLNLQAAKNKQLIVWWRRRESNPRPKSLTAERLHAQSSSIDFALCAQNRQDAHNPSPEISLLRLGPGRREPACCMTSFRGPQTKPRRTATYLIKQLMPVDCWQLFVLRAITGAHTPACLYTAIDPVETVTPPSGGKTACSHRDTTKMILFFALSPACR